MADPRDGLVRINFVRGDLDAIIARARGQAQEILRASRAANEEIALGMQQQALERLKRSIAETGRPQRPTQYLVRAVESPDFIRVSDRGFEFGTQAFLRNESISAYWRGIEFGSDKFVGRTISGYFLGGDGSRYPAMRDRIRKDPRLIYATSTSGLARGVERKGGFPFQITITRPIPEYRFMRDTIEAYEAGVINAVYERHLGRFLR